MTYEALLRKVLDHGVEKTDRTGVGTREVFAPTPIRYDLRWGFPLITTKYVPFDKVVDEMLWFLSGSTNVNDLNSHIWDAWADEDGSLGPTYGVSLRDHHGKDQIIGLTEQIRSDPDSRRHIVTTWNPSKTDEMNLPPCHGLVIQFNVQNGYLDLHMYQRSADLFLGVPWNIAEYALLLHMVAESCNLVARNLVMSFGSAHIYLNHTDQVREQIGREPYRFPILGVAHRENLVDYVASDFDLLDYKHHPKITGKVAV